MSKRIVRKLSVSLYHIVGLAWIGRNGRDWYNNEWQEFVRVGEKVNIDPERLVDIVAITSPRVRVARNGQLAILYALTGSTVGMMNRTRDALYRYETSGEISGPKVRPFAQALKGDGQAIVLDVHMATAFECPQSWFANESFRAECESTIRQAAAILGWQPAEVQAAVWTAITQRNPRKYGGTLQLMRWADSVK